MYIYISYFGCQIGISQPKAQKMPIPIEKIQAVENEIERERDCHDENTDDGINTRYTTAMTLQNQDFSYLKHPSHAKRSVHYDIEQMDPHESQPLRTIYDSEPLRENVLRRRYIAHWGLPG